MVLSLEYLTNEKGERTKVVLPVEEYQRMLEEVSILRMRTTRRELLALSPEERKSLLEKQAEGMAEFYKNDEERREWEAIDDFHDYDNE
jgi:PHD/YefM family antitoxin component YafN of YafNO toxin-antitoxin module